MSHLGAKAPTTKASYRRVETESDLPVGRLYDMYIVEDDGDGYSSIWMKQSGGWERIADPRWSSISTSYPKRKDLSSQVDGITVTFTLPTECIDDTLMVFVNGLAMTPGLEEDGCDFSIDSTTEITFYTAPVSGVKVLTTYVEV